MPVSLFLTVFLLFYPTFLDFYVQSNCSNGSVMIVNAAKRVDTKISLNSLYLTKAFIIKIICTRDLSLHHFCVQALLNIFDLEEIVFCLLTDSEVVMFPTVTTSCVRAIPVLLVVRCYCSGVSSF